jgi:hypothetical protein
MRLNKNTYPAFGCFEENKLERLQIDAMFKKEIMKDFESGVSFINKMKDVFRQVKDMYYLTSPFRDAIETALPKILDKEKHLAITANKKGILFTEKGFIMYETNPQEQQDLKVVMYGFTRGALTTYAVLNKSGLFGGLAAYQKDGKPYNDTIKLNDFINGILAALYFIDNCEIEQVVAKPNTKCKVAGENHLNESKSDVTILDCRWFTELIRDTPFNVRGHYRWQVHGERNTKRKLKWINEFEKHGYHRAATKTTQLS